MITPVPEAVTPVNPEPSPTKLAAVIIPEVLTDEEFVSVVAT